MGESAKPVALVVEDDDQTAVFISHFLEAEGFAVEQAADGKQALELIAGMPPPALVTLDLDLPHATGDELMMQIKTTAGWERVPVLMLTATPKSAQTPWAVRTGARAYLAKPFTPAQLLEAVRKVTKKT